MSAENFKIAVLRDEWVMWGYCVRQVDGSIEITNAEVIRVWGTAKGLGELAAMGARKNTVLDPIGRVVVEKHDLKFLIDCEEDWGRAS